ncbi:branched-chain amino acid ABC transporter substrate-binding protein [Solirubrobacter soli]|uniref:branched-chain amino acid ABC transporter substrate-binding protein n=1 Tax=Solirubrobacter soli TaxID=363832 RepID=UPI0004819590|nr:branched-chain amino acid ABC transporter substrate-binding protein [Solirubrobacter soli]
MFGSRNTAAVGCLVGALALGVGACGSDDSGGGGGDAAGGSGKTLTIYSDMPLQGAGGPQSRSVVNGEKLALEQNGGKAGEFKIKFVSLDNSTAQAGSWTPEATTANARKVAQDSNTAVYLGEFNSGAAAVSIPILNEGGVPMISPANTYVGLTTKDPGSAAGEPDKFYPAGTRNYVRVVPRDSIKGPAMASTMKEDGCTKVELTNDKETYGAGLAQAIVIAAKQQGLNVIANDGIDKNAPNYRSLAQRAKAAGADCFAYSGVTQNNAVQLFKDMAAGIPNAKLYGPDGTCESGFINKDTGIPADVAARYKCTSPTLPPDQLPATGQQFFKDYAAKFGGTPDPYSIYGYESMQLALDAIKRSKTGEKADIVKALFATKDRESALGKYSIDANGDTSSTDMALDGVEDGQLKFIKVIKGSSL